MFSDSYPIKLVDDLYYEVEGKTVTVSNDIDDALIGGNASAEAQEDEGHDSNAVTGINIVLGFKYQSTGFDKKSYKSYIMGYMKRLVYFSIFQKLNIFDVMNFSQIHSMKVVFKRKLSFI